MSITQANGCQVALRPLFEQRETLEALLRLTCRARDQRVTVINYSTPDVSHNFNTMNQLTKLVLFTLSPISSFSHYTLIFELFACQVIENTSWPAGRVCYKL